MSSASTGGSSGFPLVHGSNLFICFHLAIHTNTRYVDPSNVFGMMTYNCFVPTDERIQCTCSMLVTVREFVTEPRSLIKR